MMPPLRWVHGFNVTTILKFEPTAIPVCLDARQLFPNCRCTVAGPHNHLLERSFVVLILLNKYMQNRFFSRRQLNNRRCGRDIAFLVEMLEPVWFAKAMKKTGCEIPPDIFRRMRNGRNLPWQACDENAVFVLRPE